MESSLAFTDISRWMWVCWFAFSCSVFSTCVAGLGRFVLMVYIFFQAMDSLYCCASRLGACETGPRNLDRSFGISVTCNESPACAGSISSPHRRVPDQRNLFLMVLASGNNFCFILAQALIDATIVVVLLVVLSLRASYLGNAGSSEDAAAEPIVIVSGECFRTRPWGMQCRISALFRMYAPQSRLLRGFVLI